MKLPSNIQFPPDVEFFDDLRLLCYRPRGVLNEASVNRAIKVLGELEFSLKQPFNRFTDTVDAEAIDLNFQYILHISLYRRLSYSGRPPVKSAILATDATAIHYARLHALLTQGSPIKVHIFQERRAAAKWLNVPVARLTAPTSREGDA
ncbi:MAG TPA: hypothetical protein VGI60_05000 [Chthoniobacterales bacterium]